jgi:hypothetical protein
MTGLPNGYDCVDDMDRVSAHVNGAAQGMTSR